MKELNSIAIFYKNVGLHPLIKIQLDQQNRHFKNWNKSIKKIIDIKIKANCQTFWRIYKIDIYCYWGKRPSKVKESAKSVEKSKFFHNSLAGTSA